MEKQSDVAIGTWPTPETPRIAPFKDRDMALMKELNAVFMKHGLDGRIKRIEFDCGTPPPKPKPERICFRMCIPGPDDRPYCVWMCW